MTMPTVPPDFERSPDEDTLFVDYVEGTFGTTVMEEVDEDGITTSSQENIPTLVCHGRIAGHKAESERMFILAFSEHGWEQLTIAAARLMLEQITSKQDGGE